MSDPSQSDAWPPRWDPPPPAKEPAAAPFVPTAPAGPPASGPAAQPGLPVQPTPSASGAWPTYELPPDLPSAAATSTHPYAPVPHVSAGPPPARPKPPRRAAPWPLVGAVALATTVGVAATLAFVQPWASGTDQSGGTVTTYVAPTGTSTPDYPTSVPTTSDDIQLAAADPTTALQQQAAADRASIAQVPEGYWVPQLSSKRDGLVADGITYSPETIWADHTAVRSANPGAALLWSGDYTTFKYPDFWVTLMPTAYSSTPDGANSWCAARGFDADHCFAKRISTTTTYTTTTQNR